MQLYWVVVSGFSFAITHHCKIFLSLIFSQNFLDCFHSVSILTGKHCHFYFIWLKVKGEYDSIHLRIIWIISKAPAYNIVSNVFYVFMAFFFQLSWHKVMSLISAYLAFLFFRLMNVLLQLVLNPQNFTWGLVYMTGLDNCMPSSWVLFKICCLFFTMTRILQSSITCAFCLFFAEVFFCWWAHKCFLCLSVQRKQASKFKCHEWNFCLTNW